MNEPEYNNQVITEYLLGSLADAEAERFDELSFTDDAFADALKSAENDLVDSYARGELTGRALEKFKSHYLASPMRREKANFAQAFQVFAKRNFPETNQENFIIPESEPNQTFAKFFSALNIFSIRRPALKPSLAFAMIAVVIIFGSWYWVSKSRLGQTPNETLEAKAAKPDNNPPVREPNLPKQIEENQQANLNAEKEIASANQENELREQELKKQQALHRQRLAEQLRASKQQPQLPSPKISVAAFILLPPMRGSGTEIPSLSIPAKTDYVRMQLQLESDDFTAYRIALVDQSGNQKLWLSGKLKTKNKGENKVLNIRFPAKLLKPQIYSLAVSGIGSGGDAEVISDYSFRAMLK